MSDLVTLPEAKEYIRVLHDDEDQLIAALVGAASETIREAADRWVETGETPVRLRLATLMLVAEWYDLRGASSDGKPVTPLPHGVSWLIAPFRRLEA